MSACEYQLRHRHKKRNLTPLQHSPQPASLPLLRLLAELRNHIYNFAFSGQIVHLMPRQRRKSKSRSSRHHNYTGTVAFAVSCRHIHAETRSLYLSTCIFDINRMRSRDHVLATLGVYQCNAIESSMLDEYDIDDMVFFTIWTRKRSCQSGATGWDSTRCGMFICALMKNVKVRRSITILNWTARSGRWSWKSCIWQTMARSINAGFKKRNSIGMLPDSIHT